MCSVRKRRIRLRPILYKVSDLATFDREERNGFCVLYSIADLDLRYRFGFATHETDDVETPRPMRNVFVVHASEALGATNAFLRLRLFEHEVRRQDGSYGGELVADHEAPELSHYINGYGSGHRE